MKICFDLGARAIENVIIWLEPMQQLGAGHLVAHKKSNFLAKYHNPVSGFCYVRDRVWCAVHSNSLEKSHCHASTFCYAQIDYLPRDELVD